jgi:hypothetical protein
MVNTLAQKSMEECSMHEGQCQMHQPFQVMLVHTPLLGGVTITQWIKAI